jgi:hypothetical protein
MKCEYHVCDKEAGTRRYCCRPCNTKHRIHKVRKIQKQRAVDYLGSRCSRCGYNRCVEALHFHHLRDKLFEIGKMIGYHQSWPKIEAELDKCVLLCANCHHEFHYGGLTEPGIVSAC